MPVRQDLAVGLLAVALTAWGPPAEAAANKSNILFVLTDDQTFSLADRMPNLRRLVAGQGATFTHAYYNDPLCSPSRATILTGEYKQNTGVDQNSYAQFAPHQSETVAVALHAVGYHTALIGKYINGYSLKAGIPPGWDQWFVTQGDAPSQYNYKMDDNGKLVTFGSSPQDYRTDVLADRAVSFVQQSLAAGAPFYLQLAVTAPHVPAQPAARDANALPGLTIPREPAFNEADVSDKPAYVRKRGLMGARFIAGLDAGYRRQAQELLAVDDAIGRLLDTIGPAQLANTYVVFTSDNGWMQGDHRIPSGKGLPYTPVLRMPLLVSGPGIAPGATVDGLVSNADLAPTFVDWAGTTLPGTPDGRSFAAQAAGAASTRQAVPIGYRTSSSANPGNYPTWKGMKTTGYTYVEYANGERELYNDAADPYQLTNIAGTATPGLLATLHARTATLQACAGATCRAAEDASLP